jgi:hypothetical protein
VPGAVGGVKVVVVPVADETVPPVVVQFAFGLAVAGVTVAVRCDTPFVKIDVASAPAEIPTALTVTAQLEVFVESTALVATMEYVPGVVGGV